MDQHTTRSDPSVDEVMARSQVLQEILILCRHHPLCNQHKEGRTRRQCVVQHCTVPVSMADTTLYANRYWVTMVSCW